MVLSRPAPLFTTSPFSDQTKSMLNNWDYFLIFLIEKGSIQDTPDSDIGIGLDKINDRYSDERRLANKPLNDKRDL
jgi:hypothetical protein